MQPIKTQLSLSHTHTHTHTAYNYASDNTVAPVATVTNSVFYNNTGGTALDVFSTTELLQQLLFPGRGGGLAIIANSLVAINVLVADCLMQENSAENYGGGMYTLLDGLSNHVITVTRSRFAGFFLFVCLVFSLSFTIQASGLTYIRTECSN